MSRNIVLVWYMPKKYDIIVHFLKYTLKYGTFIKENNIPYDTCPKQTKTWYILVLSKLYYNQ